MRRLILFALLTLSVAGCRSEQVGIPTWLRKLPDSDGKNYYYRVTMAEAATYEQAYSKAFAMAILESSWKLGVAVGKTDDIAAIEGRLKENLDLKSSNLNLPLNKVCEYSEPLHTSTKIRLYILWQVARYGNIDPEFDDFNNCL